MNLINTGEDVTITLKEITDMIEVEHYKAVKKVEKLAEEPEFGAVSKMEVVYNEYGQTTTTLILNEKQAIAAAAKLNNTMLMKVINRLETLEKEKRVGAIASLRDMNQKVLALFNQGEVMGEVLTEHHHRLSELEKNRRLEAWQEKKLQDEKNAAVYRIAGDDKEFASKLHRRIWQMFKKKFHLPRYNELSVGKFEEGVAYLRNITVADCVA